MNQGMLDEVKIHVKGGDGGNGCIAFHREKFVAKGGPSGGNAGRGGSIYLVADGNHTTLNDFLHGVHFKADHGQHGMGSKCAGYNAEDKTLYVPCGTLVMDPDTDEILADLAYDGQVYLAARGGLGGRGNASFASHDYRLPRFAERGEPGEERWLRLVLKMIAQVGIIGLPNAGKSTLLARVSAATPRIAPYPFTTLVPNLGMVWLDEHRRAVFADIPGLIAGAHRGAGLGTRFLRHVERTRVLIHLIDAAAVALDDPLASYRAIHEELRHYGKGLDGRPEIVVLNKIDLAAAAERLPALQEAFRRAGVDTLAISGQEQIGTDRLLERVNEVLQSLPAEAEPEGEVTPAPPEADEEPEAADRPEEPDPTGHGLEDLVAVAKGRARKTPSRFTVRRDGERFVVEGRGLERMVAMTDLDNDEAVAWIQRRLLRMGVEDALRHAGATPGATVSIRGMEFEFQDEGPVARRPTRRERRTVGSLGKPGRRTPKTAAAAPRGRTLADLGATAGRRKRPR